MSETALLVEEVNPDHQAVTLASTAPTAMQLLLDLEGAGLLTPRALTLPPGIEYGPAEALGAFLGELKSRGNFYFGDWLLEIEARFPEQFSQASEATGLAEDTNIRVMTICRSVPPQRRRDRLSWSTHALVAAMQPREQTRWLTKAETNGWGYSELRAEIRKAREAERPPLEGLNPHEPQPDLLLEAARSLVRNAQEAGENVIVRRDDFVRVKAALGME